MLAACIAVVVSAAACEPIISADDVNPAVVRLADSFDRADASSLGSADSGQPWTSHAGSWGISAGRAAAGGGYSLSVADSGGATGVVEVDVVSPSAEYWLVVRASDSANYWRFGRRNSGPYELQQIVANGIGAGAIVTADTVQAAAGDVLTCDLGAVGIACGVNGVTVAVSEDAFNAGATGVGLATWESGGASPVRFDDLEVIEAPAGAELVVAVAAGPSVQVGAEATWTVTVRNLGTIAATAATISAGAPAGVVDLEATTASGSCTVGGSVACSLGDLAPGASASVVVRGVAAGVGDATLTVTAATTAAESGNNDNIASGTVAISALPPVGLRLADGFDRPNAGGLGTAPTGQGWTNLHGGFGIAGGLAAPTSPSYSLVVADGGGSTGVVSATVTNPSTEFWLVLRASGGSDYWRFGRWQSGPYQLQQIANGGLGTPVVTTSASMLAAAGDDLVCRLTTSGLRCTVNGVLVATTSDAFNAGASGVGFGSYGTSDVRFDDLSVTDLPVAPDLAVAVGDEIDPATVGGELRWSVVVTNGGNALATDPSVTMVAAPGLDGASVSSADGSCTVSAPEVTCALDDLAPGAAAEITVEATAPAAPGSVTLSATAATAGDADGSNDSASATTQVRAPLPPGTRILDDFERPDDAGLGTAPTGQAWTQLYGSFAISAGRALQSGAGYSFALIDGGATSGIVSTDVVVASPEFWLVVRAADGANYWRFGRSGGGAYQLQQIVGNGLGSPAVTTVASVVAAAGDRLSCRYLDGSIACSVNGALVASVATGADAAARSVGLAVWDPPGTAGTRFDEFQVVDVPPVLDVSVAVSDRDPVTVGEQLRWTIVASNSGTVTAAGVVVTATLPAGITGPAVSTTQGSCQVGATVSCAVGSLAAGATAEVVVTAQAPADAGLLALTAAVGLDGEDANAGNDTELEHTTVRTPPPPGARVTDGFGGQGPLTATDTGEAWTVHSGAFAEGGGVVAPTSAQPSLASVDTGFPFGTYELTVSDVGDRRFWLAFRIVDASNYFRVGPDQAGIYQLEKVVNGQAQPVAISIRRRDVVAADGDVIRVVNRPDDGMFVSVNGQHIVDAGDVQHMTVSRFGFAAASASVAIDHLDIGQVMTSSVIAADSFSRPNGTPMGRVESGVSYDWWSRAGGDWGVIDGQAYFTGSGYGVVGADTSSEAADFRATVTRVSDEFGLIFRFAEDGTYFRFGQLHAGGGYDIDHIDGWSSTPPPTPVERLASPTPADGDVLEVRQYLDGRIECLVDGVVVLRLTDTVTNPRGTIYGFASGGGTARFDDVVIVPE